jgi:hypothetical protein
MTIRRGVSVDQLARIRPSLFHCFWGLPFLLIGGGFFVYSIFHGITHATDSLTQVVVPGNVELSMRSGHTYTVFLERQSIANGKVYSATQSIEGLECHVTAVQSGISVESNEPSTTTSYEVNGRSGRSVLEFPIKQDGEYTFACGYDQNSKGPEVVVAIGSGVGGAIARTVLVSLGVFFASGGACIIVVLFVLMMREREKKRIWQLGQAQGN